MLKAKVTTFILRIIKSERLKCYVTLEKQTFTSQICQQKLKLKVY